MFSRFMILFAMVFSVQLSMAAPLKSMGLQTVAQTFRAASAEILSNEGLSFSDCGSHGASLRLIPGLSKIASQTKYQDKVLTMEEFSSLLENVLYALEFLEGPEASQKVHREVISALDKNKSLQAVGRFYNYKGRPIVENRVIYIRDIKTAEQIAIESDYWQDDCD